MNRTILMAVLAAFFVAALAGCGGGAKDPAALGSKNDAVFKSADPGIKANWDTALAALKTNGYAVAIMTLQEITKGTNSAAATPEQVKAVNETVTAVSDKMYDAANKGSAEAQAAIDDLRKAMGR